MSITPADVFETLRKIRMDLTNAQGKLSDTIRYLGALNFEEEYVPLSDLEVVKRMIRNGALTELVHLEAELSWRPAITASDAELLRASLPSGERANKAAPEQRSAA